MHLENDILHDAKRLRLLAAALELQHYTSTAANVVPIPGTDQLIVIGTPAHIALALEIGPVPAELIRLGTIMASTLYNLKQHPGTPLDDRTCGLLGELQQKWDTARREYREAALQQLADQTQAMGAYDVALPAKPHTTYNGYSDGSEPLWTAEQMEDYARAAIAHAATICDGVAAMSKNSLFRSGAKICAGEIRAAQPTQCAAGRDGECGHAQCPQVRDGEPRATGRHCPLDSEGGHHD